jgi:hypothetical protein
MLNTSNLKRKIILMLTIINAVATVYAQPNILFVNDNAVNTSNTSMIIEAINETGYGLTIFDAVENMASPTFDELMAYDLVIWYTSTDGVGLYLWNGIDEDNQELISYLEFGGNLWVMGNDFLYDRYATPWDFSSGEFVYDYLGTSQYYAQSYGDDGNVGVAQLDLEAGQEITSLNPILWSFATAWWIDACLARAEAIPVYRMGPGDYMFDDYLSGIYYPTETYHTLSFFFDPALMDTDANRTALFTDVLSYFEALMTTDTEEIENPSGNPIHVACYPNPAKNFIHISTENSLGQIEVFNQAGQRIYLDSSRSASCQLNISEWDNGMYLVKISNDSGSVTNKIIKKEN